MSRLEPEAAQLTPTDLRAAETDAARTLTRRRFLTTAGVAAAGLAFYSGEIARHELEVVDVPMHLRGLPDAFHGMRVAQISDIHYDNFTEPFFVRRVVQRVNELRPDVVLLTGDYVSKGQNMHLQIAPQAYACAEALRRIECPVRHAILGNHDVAVGPQMVMGALYENGIPTLVDQYVPLERDGRRIWIVGLHDVSRGTPDLDAAMPPAQAGEPIIAMVHEPDYTDTLLAHPQGRRADLVLAGHSHGGQICLPVLGPMFSPPLAKKYRSGMYRFDAGDGRQAQLYVNRGIGTIGLPLRMNCPPEITVFTLSAEPV